MSELERLRTLEKTLRALIECEDYGSGHLSHHDDCNLNHAWGETDEYHDCDCAVKPVKAALNALNGTVLDDIVEALNDDAPACPTFRRF